MNRCPVIAVLDDEPQLRKALERLLAVNGFCVVPFERGEDGIAAHSHQTIDCLLLDLHMPGVNGFDILESFAARGIRTPVIVLTGHGEEDTASRVLALGASAYLTKPVDESALLAALTSAIGELQTDPRA